MDGDGVVEIALGGAHADGDRKALQHLVGILADEVATHDLFFRADAHQFHRGRWLALGKGVVHRSEAGLMDSYRRAVSLPCLLLGQSDRGDGRMAEHHAGNVFVRQAPLRLLAEQPIG